ncbi:hypothetical protein ACFWOG_04395 [Kitasatospora sp. NPDC058406]|uniref:hypothetical protein n=1 Tax=Kitasatospora sp. NPDC058406 TaxID=3346483 RepID=UPI003650A304
MPALEVSEQRAARQRAVTARAVASADALWARVDGRLIRASWQQVAEQMFAVLVAAQQASAGGAQDYVAAAVLAAGAAPDPAGELNVAAFAGLAADGRDLRSLLELPSITAVTDVAAGLPADLALQRGRSQLLRTVTSEVTDAGRVASGAGIVADRRCTGYVRVVGGRGCARCIILAGQVYGSATAFDRHPNCQCIHEPTVRGRRGAHLEPRRYFDSLSLSEQRRRFGEKGAQAIRDGADIGQVVNARRKGRLYTTADGVKATREGTTKRGTFYRRERARAIAAGRVPADIGRRFQLRSARLMPEEIYRLAATRDEAIELLRRYAYLI